MTEQDDIDRLMAMSDEEIMALARAEGIDTDAQAREMAAQFQVIAKLVRERDKARDLLGRSWIRNAQMSRQMRALDTIQTILRERPMALNIFAGDDGSITIEVMEDDQFLISPDPTGPDLAAAIMAAAQELGALICRD